MRSYTLAGEATDGPASGVSLDRPGLAVVFMGALQQPRHFDVLLVTDIARLARDARLAIATIHRLRSRGIRIEATDHEDIDRPLQDQLFDLLASYQAQLGLRRPS